MIERKYTHRSIAVTMSAGAFLAFLFLTSGANAVVTPYSCLSHISLQVSGPISDTLPFTNYSCGSTMYTGTSETIRLQLTAPAAAACDEGGIPENSVLVATGSVETRNDGLSQFDGKFTITGPDGHVVFSGTMDLMERVDAHHPPMAKESCFPSLHAEGYIDGASPASPCLECPTYKIHALIDANILLTPVTPEGGPYLRGNLDGLAEKNPSD